jgi:protein-tyrosine phosphatase
MEINDLHSQTLIFWARLVTRQRQQNSTDPLVTPELYWIPIELGHLAIMAKPRAGEWLTDEIDGWRSEGVDVVVSLLESSESNELDLDGEATACVDAGIEFFSFPIRDRGVPRSVPDASKLIELLAEKLKAGASVAIHCRAGIGRSALIAACTLTRLGVAPAKAFELIGNSRRVRVPDTDEQSFWVEAFARR